MHVVLYRYGLDWLVLFQRLSIQMRYVPLQKFTKYAAHCPTHKLSTLCTPLLGPWVFPILFSGFPECNLDYTW